MTESQKRIIRKYLGHGQGSRAVRVRDDGQVHYRGSTSDTEEYDPRWFFVGMANEIFMEATDDQAAFDFAGRIIEKMEDMANEG